MRYGGKDGMRNRWLLSYFIPVHLLKRSKIILDTLLKRRWPDLNRRVEVLQTSALPLGYTSLKNLKKIELIGL